MSTLALPVDTVQFYNDGPDFPTMPLLMEAERAYRDGFRCIANASVRWRSPPDDLRESLWRHRKQVRRQAEVLVPSSELYGNPDMDSEQIVYRAGHDVVAAGVRGKTEACEVVMQCWEELSERGIPDEAVAPLVLKPWNDKVQVWASEEIVPTRMSPPPRPEECIPDEHVSLLDQLEVQAEEEERLAENPTSAVSAKSVRQLLNEHPSLRRPVIHGLLREGETMNVIASPKIGKSWLVVDLALAVATGCPWLETFETERGDVLIVDNELHQETSANRIPKVMKARRFTLENVADRVFVANVRGGLQDIFGLATYFQQLQPGRFKLIVLDAFYRFMPKDTDENDNGTMSQVYNHLDGYAARLGCSFVLVHHSSKGNQSGKSVTDVGAGAGSQSRATDTHLVLRPHEEPDCVVLDAAVRSWPPIEPRVLRWTFPVWTPDDSLDPAALRQERPRRRAKADKETKPPEPEWDAPRFAAAFVGATPATILAIVEAAKADGLSERKAKQLLKLAEADGWSTAGNSGLPIQCNWPRSRSRNQSNERCVYCARTPLIPPGCVHRARTGAGYLCSAQSARAEVHGCDRENEDSPHRIGPSSSDYLRSFPTAPPTISPSTAPMPPPNARPSDPAMKYPMMPQRSRPPNMNRPLLLTNSVGDR